MSQFNVFFSNFFPQKGDNLYLSGSSAVSCLFTRLGRSYKHSDLGKPNFIVSARKAEIQRAGLVL
jgi:hypothetical protein